MKIIGSKMAAKLATEKFGDGAFAMRQGKEFIVGDTFWMFNRERGRGKSWREALENAGLEIPIPIRAVSPMAPLVATPEETDELIQESMADLYPEFPDTMPEDDDPIVVEKLGSPDEEE